MRLLNKELLKEKLDSRLQADLAANRVDGVSLCVTQNGRTLYENHFGRAGEHTLFRLASMTKPITAVAILILAERGLLDLSDPVSKYLPQVSQPVTLAHLLTHTSGLSREYYVNHITDEHRKDLPSLVDYTATLPLDFTPGTQAAYSPVAAFTYLTAIAEAVSGMDYQTFLQKEIFAPCAMADTTFTPTPDQWAGLIPMHGGETVPGCVFESYPATTFLGGAGLVSSLHDYKNFAQMLLNGGIFGENRILSEESVQKMTTPRVSADVQPGPQRWGYGVRVITGENRLSVGSYGWSGTYGTHFWVDPRNRITAIYLKNSRFDGGASAVTAAHFERDVTDCLTPAP